MLRALPHNNTAGGIEVFVDADHNEVELLAETGRNFALNHVRSLNLMANAVATEYGPFPVDVSTNNVCSNSEQIKAAAESKNLVYRKKFILTFVGG